MKNIKGQGAIAVICFILGFIIVLQIRSVKVNTLSAGNAAEGQRAEMLAGELLAEQQKNKSLTENLEKVKAELDEIKSGVTGRDETEEKIIKEYEEMAREAGYTKLTGQGVTVTLTDKPMTEGGNANVGIVHDQDVLKVVNELWAAGAKGIAINGERLVATSEIRCVGNTISVNRRTYGTPFVITAVGDAKAMESGLKIPGGAVDSLSYYINIKVEKNNQLTIPEFQGR